MEDNGAAIANKASTILLEDPALTDLHDPLHFISKSWRDLSPALISLSCKAVGGRPEETQNTALAINLMHLSFSIWDDIIDNTKSKSFRPTLLGKFGTPTSVIIAGLAAAKAFSLLNTTPMADGKRQIINDLIWRLGTKMASTEAIALQMRTQRILTSKKKLWKIKSEASDLETCLKIGAIIGNGSENEIHHLGEYGLCLGTIFALRNDFLMSVNLTLELAQRITSRELPYALSWARERSGKLQKQLETLAGQKDISQTSIKEVVEDLLATNVANNIARKIRRQANKAEKELTHLRRNEATQTLRCLVKAQPKLFSESLPKQGRCCI